MQHLKKIRGWLIGKPTQSEPSSDFREVVWLVDSMAGVAGVIRF